MSAGPRVEALYPLTPSQTGMWLHSAAGGHDRFVEQAAFCLEGQVNVAALSRALQCVVDRHGALRSSILAKGLQPVRAVLQDIRINLREVDAGDDEDAALTALMDAERQRGLPLNRPPLIRFALLKVRDERAWLVLSFHHIILDGWSLLILWTEAAAFYAAELAGVPAQLPPTADENAVAQWLKARSDADSERYWRTRLRGFTTPTPLTAVAVAATPSLGLPVPSEVEHVMTPAAGGAIAAAAHACRVSPAMVFDVLWALLLAGRTGRPDVAFAATVSGRPPSIPGIERMVGCFINTVPIRIQFGAADTVRACLTRQQQQRAEQAEFEYCSAGQIQEWSELRPGDAICQSLLVFENLRSGGTGADTVAEPAAVSEAGRRVRGARTGYPVTLLISPGAAPHLRAIHQPGSLSAGAVRDLLVGLEQLALRLPAHLDDPVRDWMASVAVAPAAPAAEATPVQAARPLFVAPRTRLEHELATIWEGLFQTSPIGVLDDFFSLGGHSLMVLQMAAKLRGAIGADLPLQVLISHTTIEQLARACASLRQGYGSAGSGVDDHAAIVTLSNAGAGMPIYCPHPMGGHVLCYAALGRRLAGRHPAWGLQAKGIRPGEAPAVTWDEIIDHHWALMMSARRDAATGAAHPLEGVALLGYSYGGYIAMELAARARREGATRVPVLLLDVPHPSVIPVESRLPDDAALLHALFGTALNLELETLQRVSAAALTRYVYDAAVTHHLLPPDTVFEQVDRVLAAYRAHSRIEPPIGSYDFPVVLVRASDRAERISSLPDLGWGAHASGLAIEWVPGSHETMLDPPHAGQLADLVANYLT